MAREHEEYLSYLFATDLPVYTGSELVGLLCEKFPDCSRQNARKVIGSAVQNGVMQSSKPLTFGRNQYAYYNKNSKMTIDKVQDLLEKNRPGLYRILKRFREKHVISYYEILKLGAVPINPNKSKVTSLKQIIKIIEDMDIARPMTSLGNHYLVATFLGDSHAIQAMQEKHEEIKLDAVFIPIFIGWLKKHNVVTTNRVLYRSKTTPHDGIIHNDLMWDAVTYTNTTGYSEFIGDSYEDDLNTCIVLDVKISSPYQLEDLMGFYDRIQIYRNSVIHKEKRKILPIIVANDVDFGVKTKIKNLKMLFFNLGTVFGERIYEVVQNMKLLSFSNLKSFDHGKGITSHIEDSLKADTEEGDLIHTDDDEKADEDGFSIIAMWNWERKNYFIKE